jgi:hypothetical protein
LNDEGIEQLSEFCGAAERSDNQREFHVAMACKNRNRDLDNNSE